MSVSAVEPLQELIRAVHILGDWKFLPATDGNFSIRISKDRALVTRSGIEKRSVAASDFVEVSLSDETPDGASSEWKIHRALYMARSDVHCILHAHSPALTAFSAVHKLPDVALLAESALLLSDMVLVPYAQPGTRMAADAVIQASKTASVYLLSNHGPVVVGENVREALHRFERAEYLANLEMNLSRIGTPSPLSASDLSNLLKK